MPRVSVVIPLFQTGAYIGAALASVLAQTFTDFEVIVVDDGSSDQGPWIARATGDTRVRVVTQANRGLAGARNTGIREAEGDLIALLDADDLWAPDKLAQHVAHFDGKPWLDVSFCASRLIDADGRGLGLAQTPASPTFEPENLFCRNPIGNGSAIVLRRRALDRIRFVDPASGRTCWFDESFRQSEDVECWMRLAALGRCTFGYIDRPLTHYRVNSGGLSANIEAQLATWVRFRDKVATYAPELVARHGRRAEGYQLRYLARRAVMSGDRRAAGQLILRAFRTYPHMLQEEPQRTLSTFVAAALKCALPARLFGRLERSVLQGRVARSGLRL